MPSFSHSELSAADTLIALALAEDLGDSGDLTAGIMIPVEAKGSLKVVARQPGVVSGLLVAARLAEKMKLARGWSPIVSDGATVVAGEVIARVEGSMQGLLAFERTALNFLQHLSGIATLTARFVAAVAGTKARILDTRKTLPGWRVLEKYAVRGGGGMNHRLGLFDAVLIKDNHLAWLAHDGDPIGRAVAMARKYAPRGMTVEIEVDTLDQFDRALAAVPDIILVDNFNPERLREAVRRRDAAASRVELEASGGVNLDTVRSIAETGVDRISVGALTHSAPALDIGLDFEGPAGGPTITGDL